MTEFAMGWLADRPDIRDLTLESPQIQTLLQKADGLQKLSAKPASRSKKSTTGTEPTPLALPATVDLRADCPPIENQGGIGSCTANAGVGLLEYFERKAFGKHLDASRLFLYKATRNLLHWTGDTGAYLRATMKAMAAFGVCPEEYWPYSDATTSTPGTQPPPFDQEPPAFCYAFAGNYKSTTYYRLDPPGVTPAKLLENVKTHLAGGLPSMFGFTVYSSYSQTNTNGGRFPFPSPSERVVGGHAVVAVGYDDGISIPNATGGPTTTGALLIRNSWGTGWGMSGYGYLPYEYILRSQATDFWSLIKAEYLNTGQF
jgi:C1A family cysteine protease